MSCQSRADRILADVLPLLRIALAVSQSMMKSAGLKCSCVRMSFRKAILPETHPAFDGEFQVAWRAEQMQMIGH